jgi:alkanesulfonate monooxygenase SsuD/methylene tetrahydromethanopterin reductase-like flavin-dependent oxidoreductase (luciferase family)
MSGPAPLSILDLAPVSTGGTGAEALHNTVDLARRAERLGYRRFWLAEHHLTPGVAAAAPGVLTGLVTERTERIRVGSAAVLLGNVTPLEAVEQFGTVAQLHPGRIDLGLGRSVLTHLDELAAKSGGAGKAGAGRSGAGRSGAGDRVVDGLLIPAPPTGGGSQRRVERLRAQARLLGVPAEERPYREQVREVLAFLAGTYRDEEGREVRSVPAEGADLDVWVLGSSAGPSARTAGALGLPFAANYHINPSTVLETVEAYREAFQPGVLPSPHVVVSADVVVAEDDAAARELAEPYAEWVHSIRTGDGAERYRCPLEARTAQWTDEDRALVRDRTETQFVGSPGTVVAGLTALRRATGADELLITTVTHEHRARVRSYELLAQAWR